MVDLEKGSNNQIIPISEEERLINEAKPLAFNAIKVWIENVTHMYFPHSNDFRKSLADGIILCNLLNCLKPGSIKRINKVSTPISGYDNIGKFLRCCEDDFGLSSLILFELSDLEDLSDKLSKNQLDSEKRLERVLMCLFHLAKSVENHLTNVIIDSAPFSLLLKSQDIREMKKNKSNLSSDDSVFNSPVPELIQKQTPDYLTKTAEETLNKTKINQEKLHKSVESDDWQESLENWKERRRQALSLSVVDNSFDNADSGSNSREMAKLKEKARQMKELRDQIKSQSFITSSHPPSSEHSASIPDIDDETKAMIEKVKLKKLAEEQKRRFSVSSPNINSTASDSEHSISTSIEKKMVTSVISKNDSDFTVSSNSSNLIENDKKSHLNKSLPSTDRQTRILQFKLAQRARDGNLWGMELSEKSGIVYISKVKIGSSADVCEIRKDDEIVAVNSQSVVNQSVETVKSLFNELSSAIPSTECVVVTIKRLINEDEDEEFLSEMLETTEDNSEGITDNVEFNYSSEKFLQENNIHTLMTNVEDINDIEAKYSDSECRRKTFTENSNNCLINAKAIVTPLKVVEKLPNYQEDISSVNNISAINSEIPQLSIKNTESENDKEYQASVQEKIAKFESQSVSNSAFLSSSLNISKNNTESLFSSQRFRHRSTCEGVSPNPEYLSSRLIGKNQSSISNSCLYWETETPKSITSYQNIETKSIPAMQTPIHSSSRDKNREIEIELETAEQFGDTSNINIAHTWRSPSRNSSTSDDVSALNETIIMPQQSSTNKLTNTFQNRESPTNFNPDSHTTVNVTKSYAPVTLASYPMSNSIKNTIPVADHISNAKINLPQNNVSTGIQTNLQDRQPPVYTTITTAFENQCNRPHSNSVSKISDDDYYSVSLQKNTDNDAKCKNMNIPIEHKMSFDSLQYLRQQPNNYKNDISKDLTSVTPVVKETCITPSTGSNVSCLLNENEKSVEIEVSETPQLFPMRHKSLLSRSSDDKLLTPKCNDPVSLQQPFDEDENTLKSDYIKITNLNDTVPSKKELNISEMIKTDNISNSSVNNLNQNSVTKKNKPQINDHSNSFESNTDFEHSVSTVPAPTNFKGSQNSDNTVSIGTSYSKSETVNSLKNDSYLSVKNKKGQGLNTKRSSSSKDLRILDDETTDVWNRTNSSSRDTLDKPSIIHRKNSSSNQVRFSNVVEDITNTKQQTKTFSIEKSVKTASASNREKKKQKSESVKSSALQSAKCNSCLEPAGSEDLMVIEELDLHFHLRCFNCSECKTKLGDGKTDTDVRIRRKKLHCAQCYKKSSKSRNRDTHSKRQMSNNIQSKETEI